MKEIQFSILCAKAQKLPFDVGPNANDLLTFQRIIQGCVTKKPLQYISHFQGHVGLTQTSFYFLYFFWFWEQMDFRCMNEKQDNQACKPWNLELFYWC